MDGGSYDRKYHDFVHCVKFSKRIRNLQNLIPIEYCKLFRQISAIYSKK